MKKTLDPKSAYEFYIILIIPHLALNQRVWGSILLFATGCLLMFNEINGKTFLSHIVSLGTYYLAISFLACANTRVAIPKLVPESALYIQQEEE